MRNPLSVFGIAAAAISAGLCVGVCMTGAASASSLWPQKTSAVDDLLPVDQAFALVSAQRKGEVIEVSWSIAPGYYLYRSRLGFAAEPATAAQVFGSAKLPAAARIHDERGDSEIYRGNLVAVLPLRDAGVILKHLRVRYQGCANAGVCYPPQDKLINVISAPVRSSPP